MTRHPTCATCGGPCIDCETTGECWDCEGDGCAACDYDGACPCCGGPDPNDERTGR
jgi:hypothetical protein